MSTVFWSDAEVAQLRALYAQVSDAELAAMFNCTATQVAAKAKKLGLAKATAKPFKPCPLTQIEPPPLLANALARACLPRRFLEPAAACGPRASLGVRVSPLSLDFDPAEAFGIKPDVSLHEFGGASALPARPLTPLSTQVVHREVATRNYFPHGVIRRTSCSIRMGVAMKVLLAFPSTPPSVEQLQERFGMSRASAFRWRGAWIEAKGYTEGSAGSGAAATHSERT